MTISPEEIAIWIKRRINQEQPLISLSPSMACDVVASLTDMKTEIEKRDARIAALEAQLAESVTNEREECAKVAESVHIWKQFEGDFEGNCIAAAIRARSEQEWK